MAIVGGGVYTMGNVWTEAQSAIADATPDPSTVLAEALASASATPANQPANDAPSSAAETTVREPSTEPATPIVSIPIRRAQPRMNVSSGRNHVAEFQAYKRAEAQMHLQMADKARRQEAAIRADAMQMQQDIMRRQQYEYQTRLNNAVPGFQPIPSHYLPHR
jgi:hypothetical protein